MGPLDTPVTLQSSEEATSVVAKFRRREKTLRIKAQQLENKLEVTETHCFDLVEENCVLKSEIETLEGEIAEVCSRHLHPLFEIIAKCGLYSAGSGSV
jgi:hypothetical protein